VVAAAVILVKEDPAAATATYDVNVKAAFAIKSSGADAIGI
jgi:hypothetical protein